ncbi:MAG: S-layer homology domain-containing protein, partial [Firmicutes bacterium]|nr:S-layer homology domain-containing protein [Bacillota bacterium]
TINVNRADVESPLSSDADLSKLNISAGELVPDFSADVTTYNVKVAKDVSHISVTPTVASDVYAALTVNDTPANSGVAFGPINLNPGLNKIVIKVTAEDKVTAKDYTINVDRAQKDDGDSDGGGSGGSGGGGSSPSDKEPSNDGTEVKVPAPAPKLDQSSGVASAAVDKAALDKAFKLAETNADGVKQVTIAIEKVNGAKAYKPELPAKALSGNAEQQVKLETEFADLVAPGNMFDSSKAKNADTIALSIGIADTAALDTETQALVGNRPVIELNAFIDGKAASWNNPDAPVTVAIPYKPTAKELKDPEHIVIIHIDKNGNVIPVPNGRYDTATGKVVFTTTHFSQYAVAYVTKTFDDITAYGWAQKQIEVMASKGVINGTSATTYTPAANITRADFMLLLVRALGLNAKTVDNFDDIDAGAYYADAVAIAKKLGITNGIGNNKFNPEAAISRQDMMVLAEKAMTAAKKSIAAGSAKDLNKFSDASDIADYASDSIAAMVKDGIVKGDGYRINPLGNATRAEVGVIIYRIYNQ